MTIKKTISILVAMFLVNYCNLFSQDVKKEIPELEIFKSGKCGSCHSIEKVGLMKKENQKAPDLSIISESITDAEFLSKYIKKEEKIKDKKHLMKFNGEDEDLKKLANWFISLKNEAVKQDSFGVEINLLKEKLDSLQEKEK